MTSPAKPLKNSRFFEALSAAVSSGRFVSLSLHGATSATGVPPRLDVRPVELRGESYLQWTLREGKQERHENLTAEASLDRVVERLGPIYRSARLVTIDAEWELRLTRRGRIQEHSRLVQSPPPAAVHDRRRDHILPEGKPCPFLAEIGVMTPDGQVRASKQHKFRQINRYLEFVRDVLEELPDSECLSVVDCGCGKSGLTFALHHYLTRLCGRAVRMVGLDRNEAVLQTCREIAARLALEGLEFRTGDIADYSPGGPVHLVVSLHACDTATDAAIARAIQWETRVLFAVPCCQHELAPQLRSAELQAVLQHGLLRERFASDATDALRAAFLEASGYRTQVLEFIELEHTPKNVLIRAVRRTQPAPEAAERARESAERLLRATGVETFTLIEALKR